VAIGEFHKTDPGLHRQLNRLCERQEVEAFRLGEHGPWFVLLAHVDATASRRASRRSLRHERHELSLRHHQGTQSHLDNGIALMQATLTRLENACERIAMAVERIADQHPLVRMDDISIPEPSGDFGSNGFHS
jgi:hypothetical protein